MIYFHLKLFYLNQRKCAICTSWLPGYYRDCPKKNSYLFDSAMGLKYLKTEISQIVGCYRCPIYSTCSEKWQIGEGLAKSGSRFLNSSILAPELWVGMMSSFLSAQNVFSLPSYFLQKEQKDDGTLWSSLASGIWPSCGNFSGSVVGSNGEELSNLL